MDGLILILQIILFTVLIVSAYTDITRNKVYNWCTLPAIGLGLGLAYLYGGISTDPKINLINSLLGVAAGGGIFFVVSLWGGIGFGDVKLMGAVGALSGFNFVIQSLFYSTLVGFVIAVGYLIWQERFWAGIRSSLRYAFTLKGRREVIDRMAAEAEVAETEQKVESESEDSGSTQADPSSKEESAKKKQQKNTIPFGAAIALGTFWAWFLQSDYSWFSRM